MGYRQGARRRTSSSRTSTPAWRAAHPDLAANMFMNPGESGGGKETNGVDDDGNGKIDDFQRLGLHQQRQRPERRQRARHACRRHHRRQGEQCRGRGRRRRASPSSGANWTGPEDHRDQGSGCRRVRLVLRDRRRLRLCRRHESQGGQCEPWRHWRIRQTLDDAIEGAPNTLFVIAAGNEANNNDTSPANTRASRRHCRTHRTRFAWRRRITRTARRLLELRRQARGPCRPRGFDLEHVPTKTVFTDNFERRLRAGGRRTMPVNRGRDGTDETSLPPARRAASPIPRAEPSGAPTPYAANQNNWARTTNGIDLTGQSNCGFSVTGEDRYRGFRRHILRPGDAYSRGGSELADALQLQRRSGQGTIFRNFAPGFNGQNSVFVRLRMTSNSINQFDGVYIDDVKVRCFGGFDATSFDFLDGTSMATPHVAGAAAFLFTRYPTATVAQIKDRILRSVTRSPVLRDRF